MTEQAIVEYIVNSAWQIPLLALGAWALVRIVRPDVREEHLVWVSVLALAVLLPLRGIRSDRPMTSTAASLRTSGRESTAAKIAMPAAQERSAPAEVATPHRQVTVLSVAATRWVVGLYAMTVLLGSLRLARAWMAARRLVRESREVELPASVICELKRAGKQLRVTLPEIRESSEVAGPVVVGATRAMLLLPKAFVAHQADEVRAALLHELGHVRRRDCLTNAICQFAALPVAWHPATWSIQQRIRITREMACDEMAAKEMPSGAEYARCLVSLATHMLSEDARTQAMGLFESGTMEERVMRLTELKTVTMSWRAKMLRVATGATAMLAVTFAAATFHVSPTFAASSEAGAHTGSDAQSGPSMAAQVTVAAPTPVANPRTAIAFSAKLADVRIAKAVQPLQQEKNANGSSPTADDDSPTATAGKGDYVHRWVGADGKKYVMVNRDPNEPTAEARLREEQKLRKSLMQLDELKLPDLEMKLHMEDLNKSLANIDVKAQIDAAKLVINDPKLKQQMAELKKQMESPEWRKQFADAQKQMEITNSLKDRAQVQVQMAGAQEQMAKVQEQMAGAREDLAKAQKEFESGELKAKLDAAQRMLDEVRKEMDEMQKK